MPLLPDGRRNLHDPDRQGKVITVRRADIPAATTTGFGSLVLRAASSNRIVVIQNSNNFVAGDWTR
jgi:hypothetical protein